MNQNDKPALIFDKKYHTDAGEVYIFPFGYTMDEVSKLLHNQATSKKDSLKLKELMDNLDDSWFPYKGIEKLGFDKKWDILFGMASGFNPDDIIWYSIEDKKANHRLSEKLRNEIEDFSPQVENSMNWVISPKTWKRIKPELIEYKKQYGLDTDEYYAQSYKDLLSRPIFTKEKFSDKQVAEILNIDLKRFQKIKNMKYAKGGKVKIYAVLRSPMGEIIADIEVDSENKIEALRKFREMGINDVGTIYFTNNPPYYYADGGELQDSDLIEIVIKSFRDEDAFIFDNESGNYRGYNSEDYIAKKSVNYNGEDYTVEFRVKVMYEAEGAATIEELTVDGIDVDLDVFSKVDKKEVQTFFDDMSDNIGQGYAKGGKVQKRPRFDNLIVDGGMMADGGIIKPEKPIEKMTKFELMKFVQKIDPLKNFYPKTTEGGRVQARTIYNEYLQRKSNMAHGGYMANGGKMKEWKGILYVKQTSVDYFGDYKGTSKSPTKRWFRINNQPLNKESLEYMSKPYIEKFGKENVKIENFQMMADGGEVKWQDAKIGDSARVKSENKMGLILKDYGRKFHLKFVDGTEKTYDASELEFIKDEYADGEELEWGEDLGDGFSVGNDVIVTASGKTGYISGLSGKDLLVTISEDGEDTSIVVSKRGVEMLDAPEYAKGGEVSNPYEEFLLANGFRKSFEVKKEKFTEYRKGRWYCFIDKKRKEIEVGKYDLDYSDADVKKYGAIREDDAPLYHSDRYTNSFTKFKKFLDNYYILDDIAIAETIRELELELKRERKRLTHFAYHMCHHSYLRNIFACRL
jgi:hypothetical protein